ncbi:MAG: tRNA (guanine(10)-N(2))-dimethyltransferase [Candidatus Methanomethylicia archaeon]|nr:tRNA (guanine(10)-N(2))-dimethyltransferase [Candidatus Methanomethylicia archaeon]MCX8169219.1 tRNA (guanine(10)-N(2))-dimethyltransferase [Candidatus Methanomethylicia archaeon]MDW7988999.1 tRNA (guanine(10)-N(2))-dimethyltransferase [Nitrososphaerota archaeon]
MHDLNNLKLKMIIEGKAKLYVPDLTYYSFREGEFEPSYAPVFYNPKMVFDRNLSILVIKGFGDLLNENLRVCDSLSGTGIRGIRYGLEVDKVDFIWFNDWNPLAVKLIHKNLSLNNLTASTVVSCLDARKMFYMNTNFNSRFHVIDIDPFGSPVKFLQSALSALKDGGLMCITATDIPVLFGKYPLTCLRRYNAISIKADFSYENAIRILLGYIVRIAANYNFSCTPLLCYMRSHYARIFACFKLDVEEANKSIMKIGYIAFCSKCLYRCVFEGFIPQLIVNCPNCNSKLEFSGPLWIENIFDVNFIVKLKNKCYADHLISKFLDILHTEASGPPTFYVLDEFSRRLKISSPNVDDIIEKIRSNGYFASKTHFHVKGIRTNAPLSIIYDVVKSSF